VEQGASRSEVASEPGIMYGLPRKSPSPDDRHLRWSAGHAFSPRTAVNVGIGEILRISCKNIFLRISQVTNISERPQSNGEESEGLEEERRWGGEGRRKYTSMGGRQISTKVRYAVSKVKKSSKEKSRARKEMHKRQERRDTCGLEWN
jgi:hypothetical protein